MKASFVFLAAEPHGSVTERTEHLWVRLDQVREDGWWSGTLANTPFVPGPLGNGTQVWLRADQVSAIGRREEERPPRRWRVLARWLRALRS